jgi:hypothetical protein
LWPTTFREELKVAEIIFFNCLHPERKRRTHVDDLHILEPEIFLHQLYEAAGEDSVECHQRTSKMKAKKKTQNKIKNPNPTLTNFGAIRAARVMVFSGGGPPLTLPIISKESPEGTAFTVPFNHPVAIFSLLALPCLAPSFFSEDHQDHPTH